MKINSLRISNVLSFKYFANISEAPLISFDHGLSIIIGENGSGKSTCLEVINFLFRRVICRQYAVNKDLYRQRSNISPEQKKQVLDYVDNQTLDGFRLDPNWGGEALAQKIQFVIALDDIDRANLSNIKNNLNQLKATATQYTNRTIEENHNHHEAYTFDIALNWALRTFQVSCDHTDANLGFDYLREFNFYKALIELSNLENSEEQIPTLLESFSLISSYRNYHGFTTAASVQMGSFAAQSMQIRKLAFEKSLNVSDVGEPPIFAIVRLRMAEQVFELITTNRNQHECETAANSLPFVIAINYRLTAVFLECRIKLVDVQSWQFRFEFLDTRRGALIADINALSSGQKAMVHLVFEAYGRGELGGGIVIIDEPEIHLHYQFQQAYLNVIKDLNYSLKSQYILVTHSDALINSETIDSVIRFSLDANRFTKVHSPRLDSSQKLLVQVLDNTRSTYAFFGKKVVLVEGDSDRYFFKAAVHYLHPSLGQEITVLHVGGKRSLVKWTAVFEKYGLLVYRIADLDYAFEVLELQEPPISLKSPIAVTNFKANTPNLEASIVSKYSTRTFILKDGDLEAYLNITKDLEQVIDFCNSGLKTFLSDTSSAKSKEICSIINQIAIG
jgi:predicted ATPase